MGGTSNGMGGASTPQTGAPNANLQNLFMSNMPTNPATGGAQLPQITAPARPAMQMPPRIPLPQAPAPVQQMGRPAQMPDFGSQGGQGGGRWGPGGWAQSRQWQKMQELQKNGQLSDKAARFMQLGHPGYKGND